MTAMTPAQLTEEVLAAYAGTPDPRLRELFADQGQKVQRHARRRDIHQRRMGTAEVGHAQRAEELLRGVGVVEPVADCGDIELAGQRGGGHFGS